MTSRAVKRRVPVPGSHAGIRFDCFMTDYEWLALRDLAAALGWSKTKTILDALERLSEDALGYNIIALYASQKADGPVPKVAASKRKKVR